MSGCNGSGGCRTGGCCAKDEITFPLVHSDSRRAIYSNASLLGGPEISMIRLHKGKAIGGCWHTADEHFVVWSGVMTVVVRNGSEESRKVYGAGMSGTFPKGHSHAMIAHEDCLASEWGITPEEKQLDQQDPSLRAEVDYINSKESS